MSTVTHNAYKYATLLYNIYTKVNKQHFAVLSELAEVANYWITCVLIDQLVEDVLAPDIATGEVLTVSSSKSEIQKELDYLQEVIDFDRLLVAILPDLLLYGEYLLSTEIVPSKIKEADDSKKSDDSASQEKRAGLARLIDNVEYGKVLALSNLFEVESYLQIVDDRKILIKSKSDYVRFSIYNRKIDIWKELNLSSAEIEQLGIPRFVRVGRSALLGVVDKIKELQLLESLVPATKLAKLTSGTTIGINVPPGYDIDKAIETTKKVENVLNKKLGVDYRNKTITAADVINSAGRIKAVPIFGDKGQLSRLDYKPEEPDDLMQSIEDIRRVICNGIGIPYEFLFSGDTNKQETLRRHSRYLRRLKNIQRSLCDGIRDIIYIHLANAGIPFRRDDITVDFRNKLVEIDLLDRLEFVDASLTILGNTSRFMQENAENPFLRDYLDQSELVRWMEEQFGLIGFRLVNSKQAKKPKKQQKPKTSFSNIEDEEEF